MSRSSDNDRLSTPGPRPGLWRRVLGALGGGVSPSSAAELPERIGRYRVLSLLGEGGMGVVYAALDELLNRRIAIKTIREPDPSARKRFWREARATATVNHPHVCQLFEIGEDHGRLFLAMELLTGRTLTERLAEGPLPPTEVGAIGRDTLSALSALHAEGIVHRDLKPSNVFLTPHGVKVLDFGLARPLPKELTQTIERGTELTRPGLLVGTPRYMAPEQVLGHAVDERTDIFAAGAVLYEALAGRPAFVGTTVVEVLSATLHESPPALSGSAAVVSMDRVLRRALAKKPAERFASAEEMARALAAIPTGDDSSSATVARPLTRLIVLPFRLARPDPEIDFLGFTLADAVTGSLAGLPSLIVRSSTAGQRFAGEAPDVKEVGAAVDADLVVTGTLLRSGDQLRLASQLVEAPSGTLVSSFTTQSPVGDVFSLQDELAERLVSALSLTLVGREEGSRRDVPASARAYELFLRGNEVGRDWTRLHEARELYEECLREDSDYAPAWARLARCHRLLAKFFLEDPGTNVGRAESALRRALELDPDLPIAHMVYAHIEAEGGRAREAMARLLGLARRRRNDPEVFAALVHCCRYAGLLEASLAAHRESRRLDPHISTSVSYTYWMSGDFEAVLAETGERDDIELYFFALRALGRHDEGRKQIDRLPRQSSIPVFLRIYDIADAFLSDNLDRAREVLWKTANVDTDPEALFMDGSGLADVGDVEGAVAVLTRAVDGGFLLPEAWQHPWVAGLLDRPEIEALRTRAELGREEARRVFREAGGPELLGLPS
jgi:serine/threonine protein kinase/tetratricopeptide (TPR) repeat protein